MTVKHSVYLIRYHPIAVVNHVCLSWRNHGHQHVGTQQQFTSHSPHFFHNTACYMVKRLRLDKYFFGLRWYLAEITLLIWFITSPTLNNFLGFATYVTKKTVTMVTLAVMYDSLTPGVWHVDGPKLSRNTTTFQWHDTFLVECLKRHIS
jgi:hypothetical protein